MTIRRLSAPLLRFAIPAVFTFQPVPRSDLIRCGGEQRGLRGALQAFYRRFAPEGGAAIVAGFHVQQPRGFAAAKKFGAVRKARMLAPAPLQIVGNAGVQRAVIATDDVHQPIVVDFDRAQRRRPTQLASGRRHCSRSRAIGRVLECAPFKVSRMVGSFSRTRPGGPAHKMPGGPRRPVFVTRFNRVV